MEVTLGLDFGTYQTKVCTQIIRDGVNRHRFIKFNNQSDASCFLFRSKVTKDISRRLHFGNNDRESVGETYEFFKMAAAEDEEFRVVSKLKQPFYELDWGHRESPEAISIIYLAYVIGYSKQQIEASVKQKKSQKQSSFFARFMQGNLNFRTPKINYRIQLGIPTEYSKQVNISRRRKFEQILWIAHQLTESYSPDDLKELTIDALFNDINELHQRLVNLSRTQDWKSILEYAQISVMPETAAGLIYLVKTGKVRPNMYYLSLDIGGGSSDISFFRVENNRTFTYLASESVLVASNNLYREFANNAQLNEPYQIIGQHIQQRRDEMIKNPHYQEAFKQVMKKLNKLIYRIYNQRVYRRFLAGEAHRNYDHAICYLFGGGSRLPIPSKNPEHYFEEIELHDAGVKDSFSTLDLRVMADIQPIDQMTLNVDIENEGWESQIRTLVVALGLSLNTPADLFTLWSDVNYEPGANYKKKDIEPGLYDVFKRRWV